MRPLDNHLEELLAGRPVEGGAAAALRAAVWVLNQRLTAIDLDITDKNPKSDLGEFYFSMLSRRLQIKEDIRALEAMLARAEMKNPTERPFKAPIPGGGHGYGEA